MSRRLHLVLVGGCALVAAISARPAGVVLAQAMRGPYAETPREGADALERAAAGDGAPAQPVRPAPRPSPSGRGI